MGHGIRAPRRHTLSRLHGAGRGVCLRLSRVFDDGDWETSHVEASRRKAVKKLDVCRGVRRELARVGREGQFVASAGIRLTTRESRVVALGVPACGTGASLAVRRSRVGPRPAHMYTEEVRVRF